MGEVTLGRGRLRPQGRHHLGRVPRLAARARRARFDYVLYSNYERQVEDLVDGRIDVAWNSPLAWVRARRLAAARGVTLTPLAMRDTDCDLRSVIVVRADSPVTSLADLAGRTVATGAVDSPQATLMPLSLLRSAGLAPGADVAVRRFDVGVGLHGDHIGGERDAARALVAGDRRGGRGVHDRRATSCSSPARAALPAGAVRVARADRALRPLHDDRGPVRGGARRVGPLGELLLAMDYADPAVRPLLDLEGLKDWRPPGRTRLRPAGAAVDAAGFYDAGGRGDRGGLPALSRQRRARRPRPDGGGHLLVPRALAGLGPGSGWRCRARTRRCGCTWGRGAGSTATGWWTTRGQRAGGAVSVVVRGSAGDRRWSGAERAGAAAGPPAARASRPGAWRRAARWSRPGGPPLGARWTERDRCGPTSRRSCTPRRRPASGTRPPPSTGPRRPSCPPRSSGRRPADDLSGGERAGRAHRPGAAARPSPSALPRGPAAARHPGRRRGPPHRGVHPAGPASGGELGLVGGRPGLAPDPARGARLHDRRASCSRCSGRAPSSTCSGSSRPRPRPGHRPCPAGARDEARHVAFGAGPHRAPGPAPTGATWERLRQASSAATRRCSTPPA